MKEGWFNDDYWMMCESQKEAEHLTTHYGVSEYFPGHGVVGLKGWDYFILCDSQNRYFVVPTVPMTISELMPFEMPDSLRLEADERIAKKIKWYVKPIVFGGDPTAQENIVWISADEHAKLVRWWNQAYKDATKTKK
jgi:hypothetical protein